MTRRRLLAWAGAVAACGLSGRLESQPVLLIQPGMMTTDFVSAAEALSASTGFNLRVATVLPTHSRWLTLIVGANVTPYGSTGITRRNSNAPTLFAGNVVPVLRSTASRGWLSVDVPVLLTYALGGGGENNPRDYGRDVVVEVAVTAHVGDKLLNGFGGTLRRLRLYAMADQSLTPNRDRITGVRDRFNPVALYGVTIPFGTGRNSP